jgi:hypothetical protein
MGTKKGGGVEGLVGFCRRNYMVPLPKAESLEELNARLLEQCLAYGSHTIAGRKHSVQALFEAEKEHLLPLPEAVFNNELCLSARVDKFATVIVDKNRYSVPTVYTGQRVSVLLGVDTVTISLRTRRLAVHERFYGNKKQYMETFYEAIKIDDLTICILCALLSLLDIFYSLPYFLYLRFGLV